MVFYEATEGGELWQGSQMSRQSVRDEDANMGTGTAASRFRSGILSQKSTSLAMAKAKQMDFKVVAADVAANLAESNTNDVERPTTQVSRNQTSTPKSRNTATGENTRSSNTKYKQKMDHAI